MTPALVVFDLLGTLVRDDGAVRRCFVEALRTEKLLVAADDLERVANLSHVEAFARLLAARGGGSLGTERLAAVHDRFTAALCSHYEAGALVSETPGARLTLFGLHAAGVRVAVETPLPRRAVDAILRSMGWAGELVIDAVVSGDDVPRARPAPDGVHAAMRSTGVFDNRAVAKVGTTPADLAQGTLAGCEWVVGGTYGSYCHGDLYLRPHTHLIARLLDVLDLFGIDRRMAMPMPRGDAAMASGARNGRSTR